MNTVETPTALVVHRVVFALLTVNFLVPAVSYIVDPRLAEATLGSIDRALGGTGLPVESGHLWHMLAVGNVMTLGFVCALLLVDLLRFWPALPGLCFLKGFSALYSLAIGLTHDLPAFLVVFALDGATTLAMMFFATRARRALLALPKELRPLPLWWYPLLLRPERVRARLQQVERAGIVDVTPTLFQVWQGAVRMYGRLLLRSETLGTCASDPVRASWRARALQPRAVRVFFLLRERAIAPLDMTGLVSSTDRIIRHVVSAHHDREQLVYDLELLALEDGALERLCARLRAIVDGTDPRASWLRDLVVFGGYHEAALARAARALRGELVARHEGRHDPDISLRGFLDWCAFQPTSPWAMLAAWRRSLGARDETSTLGARPSRAL